MDDAPKKKKSKKSQKNALQKVLEIAGGGNADSGGLAFSNVSSEERPLSSVAEMKGYEAVEFTTTMSAATGITTPATAATTPATSAVPLPATPAAAIPVTAAAAVAAGASVGEHSYDEMKDIINADSSGQPKHGYDDIAFHQLAGNNCNTAAATDEGKGNIKGSLSATYEVPSAVPSPSSVPSPSPGAGGYMSLYRTEPDNAVYRTPEEVTRPRRMLNRLAEGLSISVGGSRSHDDPARQNVACCSRRRVNWNCVLLVVSLVVAILAILLSMVAIGLSTKCPSRCGGSS